MLVLHLICILRPEHSTTLITVPEMAYVVLELSQQALLVTGFLMLGVALPTDLLVLADGYGQA